jgi:hypothetical protein
MSVPELSSTGTLAPAQQSGVGGTSFLDLPLELREMIYDLCAPRFVGVERYYRIPLQSKPVVTGINLLRCSKQVHNEVSQRLRLWRMTWLLSSPRVSELKEHSTGLDFSLAMSGFHDLALAKIRSLHVSFNMTSSTDGTLGICGLEVLLKLKSLDHIAIFLCLKTDSAYPPIRGSSDLEKLPSVTEFVFCCLSHIPTSVGYVGWYIQHSSIQSSIYRVCDYLEKLATKYESHRGSAYTSQPNSNSS